MSAGRLAGLLDFAKNNVAAVKTSLDKLPLERRQTEQAKRDALMAQQELSSTRTALELSQVATQILTALGNRNYRVIRGPDGRVEEIEPYYGADEAEQP